MDLVRLNLIVGWLGILAGVLTGTALGLFFHRDRWLGGYGSFQRRMARLGHIACFGLGFLNLLFAFTGQSIELAAGPARVASMLFIIGLVTMPLCCFLTAWREPFRHAFPLPVAATGGAVIALLIGLVPL